MPLPRTARVPHASNPPTRQTRRPAGVPHNLRRLGLAALLATLPLATTAQAEPRLEGRFTGRGEGLLTLTVKAAPGRRDDAYAVAADTAIPNACTGILSGLADKTAPATLRLRLPVEGEDAVCELTLRYSPDGRRVVMQAEGCSHYHGASCAFDGTLTRR